MTWATKTSSLIYGFMDLLISLLSMPLKTYQFRKKKLLLQLIIASSMIMISIPVYFSYRFTRNLTLESLKKNAFLQVNQGVVDIDNWVSRLKAHVETLANTPTIRSMNWSDIEPYLKTEVLRFSDLSSITLETDQGQKYALDQNSLNPNVFRYGQAFKPYKANVSDPATNSSNENQNIGISVIISKNFQVGSKTLGKIHNLVKLDRMTQVIDRIRYGTGSYALALNSTGRVITHSKLDSEIVGQAPAILKQENLLQNLDGSLATIAKKMVDHNRGIELTKIGNDWKYVAYLPLQEVNWSIALLIPVENIEAPLRSLDLIAAIAASLVVVVIVVLGKIQAAEQTKKLNEELEQRVHDRTSELKQVLDQVKQSQLHLVQSEKMSSLGQLVAGIAHEINNPITFIHSNLYHINHYAEQLFVIVEQYQQEHPHPSNQLQADLEQADLSFMKSDLLKILDSIKMGTSRVKKIVQSLRTFSRLDEAEKKSVDIHDGIESTLLILQHRLEATAAGSKIEVFKNYGTLPQVECYAGQLNQVFMAILVNAIDALESSFAPIAAPILDPAITQPANSSIITHPSANITISTYQPSASKICIEIADNGPGIPLTTQQQLFDPFYTTKPIGKGTGLGLSISYQIITQNHQGRLSCESEAGQGAKFIIEIPIVTSVQSPGIDRLRRLGIDPDDMDA